LTICEISNVINGQINPYIFGGFQDFLGKKLKFYEKKNWFKYVVNDMKGNIMSIR